MTQRLADKKISPHRRALPIGVPFFSHANYGFKLQPLKQYLARLTRNIAVNLGASRLSHCRRSIRSIVVTTIAHARAPRAHPLAFGCNVGPECKTTAYASLTESGCDYIPSRVQLSQMRPSESGLTGRPPAAKDGRVGVKGQR